LTAASIDSTGGIEYAGAQILAERVAPKR